MSLNIDDKIINGKFFAQQVLSRVRSDVHKMQVQHNIIPKLVLVLVGSNPASAIYVRKKARVAREIGIISEVINAPDDILEDELVQLIVTMNIAQDVHGIIVQLPLPVHINLARILSIITPEKDVDGFHPINVGLLHSGSNAGMIPCTPLGCLYLLKNYIPDLSGTHVAIIGRSQIVGRPLASLLLNENCTVTVCHSHTHNLQQITTQADVVISAVGKPGFLGVEYFHKESIVLDVGINKTDTTFVGDVNFSAVAPYVRHITPVPGGVGPMTVAYLMSNTVRAAAKQQNTRPLPELNYTKFRN